MYNTPNFSDSWLKCNFNSCIWKKKEENLEIKCNCDEKFNFIEQKIEELQKEVQSFLKS